MNEIKKKNYENLAESLIEQCNRRGIEAYYCEDKQEALQMSKRFLTPGCSISFGGSETLKEIGLIDYLKASDYQLIDRTTAHSEEERTSLYTKTVSSDFFFMSSNAVTLDGELVNIDGNGNRVACLICGPKNVIVVVGTNKMCSDIETAVKRVRDIAAPPNAIRLGLDTPCSSIGRCADCLEDSCMCCQLVITRKSRIPNRIKLLLVGEELGY